MGMLQQKTVHVVPAVACLWNAYLTNTVLSRKMVRPFLMTACLYLSINFCQTVATGEPVYSFLTWKGIETPIYCTFMLIVFSGAYLLMCSADEFCKNVK